MFLLVTCTSSESGDVQLSGLDTWEFLKTGHTFKESWDIQGSRCGLRDPHEDAHRILAGMM